MALQKWIPGWSSRLFNLMYSKPTFEGFGFVLFLLANNKLIVPC